jgi:malonate transporter
VESIVYSLTTVGPVFLIIAIGVILRRAGLIDSSISGHLSRLVFHVFLPALLLKTLISTDFTSMLSLRLIAVVWGTLFLSFAFAWFAARFVGISSDTRGLFASGATWSNVAIVGYALGEALYGEEGLARAAIFSALVLPLHTPIGYFAMDRQISSREGSGILKKVFKRLAVNPIILAIFLGIFLSLLPVQMPVIMMDILAILGRASLPLALVAIGGSLEFTRDPAGWTEPLAAAGIKLVLMPVLAFAAARIVGLNAAWTGSIVVGFSCPTAVSFFVISRSLSHDASRSAAIVTATTLGSALTAGVITALLKSAGLA